MTDDKTNSLPILDDIIKTGSNRQPSADIGDDFMAPATPELKTNTAGAKDPGSAAGGDPQQVAGLPDIDALTEEILFSILPELEQGLRLKIRAALSRHFADASDSD